MDHLTGRVVNTSKLPNLLILGAAKSGTSSLYRYLSQHPQVFMPRFKEPTFFAWDGREYDIRGPGVRRIGRGMIGDIESYLDLFSAAGKEPIRGEASTGYLHTPRVPERIRELIPEAKLMAILRNPIERAYSAFLHARREGFEPLSDFEQALDEEPSRVRSRWIGLTLYVTVGMYAEQLERYLAIFPSDQIRVYLFDDLIRDPLSLAQDAFRFLEIDDSFEPNVSRHANAGTAVRSVRLYRLYQTMRQTRLARRLFSSRSSRRLHQMINEKPKGELPLSVRRRLADVFQADVRRLSRQLDRDLAPWLEGGRVRPAKPGSFGSHPSSADAATNKLRSGGSGIPSGGSATSWLAPDSSVARASARERPSWRCEGR